MQLGISSFTYGWNVGVPGSLPAKPLDETGLVAKVLDFGLHCLQIGDNMPVHQMDSGQKQALKTWIQKHQIRLELGARGLTAENLAKYIELCKFFESPLLRFVIDAPGYEPYPDEVAGLVSDFLPALKDQNLTLGIENHDRFKARELADLMEQIGSEHVGICLDCVNSMGAGEGLEQVAGILAPYTVNLHIKDFSIRRLPHQMGFTVQGEIAGKGMTDLPWLIEKVAAYGRCQSAILEQWVPPADHIEATCRKEISWAAESLAYVKSVLK